MTGLVKGNRTNKVLQPVAPTRPIFDLQKYFFHSMKTRLLAFKYDCFYKIRRKIKQIRIKSKENSDNQDHNNGC